MARIVIAELRRADVTPDTLDPDAELVDALGIDSMDLAAITLLLQDEYGIVIDEDEQRKLKTVRAICDCIERARGLAKKRKGGVTSVGKCLTPPSRSLRATSRCRP